MVDGGGLPLLHSRVRVRCGADGMWVWVRVRTGVRVSCSSQLRAQIGVREGRCPVHPPAVALRQVKGNTLLSVPERVGELVCDVAELLGQ